MKYLKRHIISTLTLLLMAVALSSAAWSADTSKDIFILKTTTKTMPQVITAVKAFTKAKGIIYLGDYEVRGGQVILVKFCVPSAGIEAWKAGLKISAMLPCGNMAVYKKDGKTEISLLNPSYMNTLYPNPHVKKAGEMLVPLYKELMTTITK